MKKFILLLMLLPFVLQGQQQGSLLIHTNRSNTIIHINDSKFVNEGNNVPWDSGHFAVKFWAPETILVTDTFSISPGKVTIIRKELPYSDHYNQYVSRQKKFRKPLRNAIIASSVFVALTGVNLQFMIMQRNKTTEALEDYRKSISEVDIKDNRTSFDDHHKKYDFHRRIHNSMVVAGCVAIPTSILLGYIHYKKHHIEYKPEYILLSRVTPFVAPLPDNLSVGFIYNISK